MGAKQSRPLCIMSATNAARGHRRNRAHSGTSPAPQLQDQRKCTSPVNDGRHVIIAATGRIPDHSLPAATAIAADRQAQERFRSLGSGSLLDSRDDNLFDKPSRRRDGFEDNRFGWDDEGCRKTLSAAGIAYEPACKRSS
jgi:hypothetical protein